MISRTAVHQLETAVAKRLRGIGVSAQVDDDRLLLVIDDEVADVIMIMALGIVATLGSKKPVLIACHHDLRVLQIGILRMGLHCLRSLILAQHGKQHQLSSQLRIVA